MIHYGTRQVSTSDRDFFKLNTIQINFFGRTGRLMDGGTYDTKEMEEGRGHMMVHARCLLLNETYLNLHTPIELSAIQLEFFYAVNR